MRLWVFLIILLSPSVAYAQHFEEYSMTADVTGNTVLEEVGVTYSNISELTYVVSGQLKDLQVTSRDGHITYNFKEGPSPFLVISDLSDKRHLTLRFKSSSPLIKRGEKSEVQFKVRFPLNVTHFTLKLILPKNALPTSTRDTYSLFPTPTEWFTHEGRYVIVWELKDVKSGTERTFSAVYQTPERSYTTYLLTFLLVFLFVGGGLFYRRKRAKMFLKGLDKYERRVVELLMEGKVEQKEIQGELGISKVKMTRVIQRLEEKGIVEKEKLGRRNRLHLR